MIKHPEYSECVPGVLACPSSVSRYLGACPGARGSLFCKGPNRYRQIESLGAQGGGGVQGCRGGSRYVEG